MEGSEGARSDTFGANVTKPGGSRRQRLMGFAKATRDTYIPRFTGSVSQLASGVSLRAWGGNDLYDEFGQLRYPKDTTITLYPSYTRQANGEYHIDVRGWISCPGLMTRKNRLILSLARQITKYNSNVAATEAIDKLSSDKLRQETLSDSDSDTLSESSSIDDYVSPSSNPSSVSTDELIKERLASFIARSIPNAELTVVIGSHDVHEKVYSKNIVTDNSGRFDEHIVVPYKPSVVQVKASTDDSIFSFQDISLVPNKGIGLISDIDDTVKLTGVIGDKRKLMTTLLLNEVALWKIPPVISWYDSLYKTRGVSFHYVSNSPWQLFGAINQYFKESKLPAGSMHLKQYTGNILSSLIEPSSSRKKTALSKILEDFSEKQFICVGDSGEHDLEAYVDLAKSYPNRILAIYIRYVENSLSDVDENKVWWEIEKILHEYNSTKKQNDVTPKTENGQISNEIEDLIDLTDAEPAGTQRQAKLPPMVPKKPSSLKGNQLQRKPPPPERPLRVSNTDPDIRPSSVSPPPPPLPRRTKTSLSSSDTQHMMVQLSSYDEDKLFELEETDSRGAESIRRILESVRNLQGTNTILRLFKDDEPEFFKTSMNMLNDFYKKNEKKS